MAFFSTAASTRDKFANSMCAGAARAQARAALHKYLILNGLYHFQQASRVAAHDVVTLRGR